MLSDVIKMMKRKLRLVRVNRNFWAFLIFLAISIVFWFMQSIKEMTEISITYALTIEDVPKDVIYTSDMPKEVNVNYTGKGWNAFYYKFMTNDKHELQINFKDITQSAGKLVLDANTFRRATSKNLPQGLTYKSTTPNKIEVYYSNGQHKRVPVVFNGHITTTAGRYLCGTILTPDSVDVYAPDHLYKSITSIKTENVTYKELEDTTMVRMSLLVPHGAKTIPDSIDANICVDIFTDKTIQVPIYCENVPSNKIMRTFPLHANITFLVSSTLYEEITAENFLLVVDYKEAKTTSQRCKLHIRQHPESIRNLRISPESVEYIIEENGE